MRARPRAALKICSAIASDATTHRTPNSETFREAALPAHGGQAVRKSRGACAGRCGRSPGIIRLPAATAGRADPGYNYQLLAFPPHGRGGGVGRGRGVGVDLGVALGVPVGRLEVGAAVGVAVGVCVAVAVAVGVAVGVCVAVAVAVGVAVGVCVAVAVAVGVAVGVCVAVAVAVGVAVGVGDGVPPPAQV